MQAKNQNFSDFFSRTSALAAKLGLNLSDLPAFLGFSKPMLFAYRAGKNPISDKAWRKLEAAERAAGLILEGASRGDGPPLEDGASAVSDGKVKYLAGAAAKKNAPDYQAAFWDAAERLPLPGLMDLADDLQARKPPGYEAILDRLLPLMKSRMAGIDPAAGKDNIPSPPDTP